MPLSGVPEVERKGLLCFLEGIVSRFLQLHIKTLEMYLRTPVCDLSGEGFGLGRILTGFNLI